MEESDVRKEHREALNDLRNHLKSTVEYQNYDDLSDIETISNIHQKYDNPLLTDRNGYGFKSFYDGISWEYLPDDGRKAVQRLDRAWIRWVRLAIRK